MLEIGVDLDEVVFDFVSNARNWLRLRGHKHPMPDPVEWDLASQWGIGRGKFNYEVFERGIKEGYIFRTGRPYPEARYALQRLVEVGRVHLVTNRPLRARANTMDWLVGWLIPYDSLTFIKNKAEGPRCDVYIDDRPRNYDLLEAAGMRPYFRTHPWNKDHPGRRVADLNEFADEVERLANG